MKPPLKIRVGMHVYTIRASTKKIVLDDAELNGYCDPDELVIRLRKSMRRSKARDILWHEVGHAASAAVGCPIPYNSEEKFIHAVFPMLLQVLRENPGLTMFLLADK